MTTPSRRTPATPTSAQTSLLTPEALDALGVGELLPTALAPWRPLVLEGLAHFLNALPPGRQAALLAAQMALPAQASDIDRLLALLLQCPTLHKLGQVLARQPHLNAELRLRLRTLESLPAMTDAATLAQMVQRLHAAFDADAPGLQIDAQPLAEGSVAVVLPFTWEDGGKRRDGVFKVLRPGVEQRLHDELALLPGVARFLARRGAALRLPALDYAGTLEGVRRLLADEVQLSQEQAHLRAASAFYSHNPEVQIPHPLPWCAPWVTAMERIDGPSLADADLPAPERARLARVAIDALLAQPFWSARDPALFHGDLHGGNLRVTPDGRLAVLDWALVAPVDKAAREALVAAVVGALTLDAVQVRRALARLGAVDANDPVLAARVDRALDELVRSLRPASFDWLLRLLDQLGLEGHIAFDPALSLFRKTWLSLAGVLADLGGGVAPDGPLLQRGLRQFLREWPQRWTGSDAASANRLGTHVSNADLGAALVAAWWSGWQFGARAQSAALERTAALWRG